MSKFFFIKDSSKRLSKHSSFQKTVWWASLLKGIPKTGGNHEFTGLVSGLGLF